MTQTDLSSIPIDIHANRLLDWLISRRHCTKDWPEKIEIIRQKINEAIKDMPENASIVKILGGASPINYFHCVKIVEVLKETEAESKNIFGMYGSRRMKDWQDILKSYQKDHLYLSECASILSRNVVYEIPALKRLITKLEQSHAECLKKESSYKKQAQDGRDKFLSSCQQLGLHFEAQDSDSKLPSVAAVGKELTNQMSQELPAIFEKIAEKSKGVKDAVAYYRRFLTSVTGSNNQGEEYLSLLYFVIENGNRTTYEWKHGEPPLKVEPPELNYTFEEEADGFEGGVDVDVGEIDFGDLALGSGDVELETGEIDWGGIEVAEDDGTAQIDFSIDDVETTGITLEDDGIEGGVARNEEALTVLENTETREEFINQIVELEGFLSQRIDEIRSQKPNELMLTTLDDSVTLEQLQKLHKAVSQLYNTFNETKTKQFLLVRESKRYVIRIAESLLQNLKLARKLDYLREEVKVRATQYGKEAEELRPRVQVLTKQSRELQAELAKEISLKYDNRPVYITGGV